MALALSDMEAACRQLDDAVERIDKRHSPLGCLPFVLAGATGAIVAGATAGSIRWYFSALLSLGGAAAMWLGLTLFNFMSWSRHHPLLARMYKLRHERSNEAGDDEQLRLGKAIVKKYLPEAESAPLIERLDDATERTADLLGLDEDEPVPTRHAEA